MNVREGMVLRVLVEGLMSSCVWKKCLGLYLLMILDEAVVKLSVFWTHTVLKALVCVIHYLTIWRVRCMSHSC